MNKQPLISVLMPAYNAEKYISESINSILNQTYKNFELIIIDDNSTDDTYKIIKKYEKSDKRIKSYKNRININIAANRNLLISKSKGEFIAWQDADDISLPDRLTLQVNYLLENKSVGILGGFLEVFDEKGNSSIRKYDLKDVKLRKKIFMFSPVAQPSAMLRREAIKFAGVYGEDLSPAEDIDMSFRIGTKYKFANLQKIMIKYRDYPNSATYKKLKKIELVTIKIRIKYILNKNYKFSLFDLIYNLLQFTSIFFIPSKFKIKIFNFIRNS